MRTHVVAVGCDHGGYALKEKLLKYLKKKGYQAHDVGTFSEKSMDYPDTAYKAAKLVSDRCAWRGLLICKSGIGNVIVANKIKGVRAALCYNIKGAKLSRLHNDANILVLGSSFVSDSLAKKIVSAWFTTPFEGGRHLRRIKKIERIERSCRRS